MPQDTGASASQTGLSQAEPEEVSALRASIPSALVERMQGLSFSLAMGGLEETDPAKLLDRIEQGVDLIQQVETMRAAEIVEEMSKLPVSWGTKRITWGEVKTAILARCAIDPVRYQAGEYGIDRAQLLPSGSRPASAIEARRAATGNTDAVHESAVAESETPIGEQP